MDAERRRNFDALDTESITADAIDRRYGITYFGLLEISDNW